MSSVSVVIPTYNRAVLLATTLRSVLAQSVPPDEIIIIDDGSTDHTSAVCAKLPASVRYIRQENRGLSVARNRGIAEASSEWIALCDSDDCWLPRKLEHQLAALDATNASWSVTGCALIGPHGEPLQTNPVGFERVFPVFADMGQSADQLFARWLDSVSVTVGGEIVPLYAGDAFGLLFEGNIALPSSAIIARSVISRVGVFDERLRAAEETEFFHRVAAFAPIVIVMESLVEYRVGHASIISTSNAAPLIHAALASGEQAAKLRSPLTKTEQRAYLDGRRRLWTRLAYHNLSALDRHGARVAAMTGWREGRWLSLRAAAIILASLAPASGLQLLYRAKQKLKRAAMRSRLGMGDSKTRPVRIRPGDGDAPERTDNQTDSGAAG